MRPQQLELFEGMFREEPTIQQVFQQAIRTHLEREEKYKGAWKSAGALDSLMHVRSKAKRLSVLETEMHVDHAGDERRKEFIDDAIDLMVYAAFFIANVYAGRVRDE